MTTPHAPAVEGTTQDIRVASPSDYLSSTSSLPQAGRCDLLIKEFEQRTKNDLPINAIEITLGEIVDAQNGQPKFVRNLSFYGTTFYREGIKVSQLGDLMAGIDAKEDWSDTSDGQTSIDGAIKLMQKAVDRAIPIRVRFDWESFDQDGYQSQGGTWDKTPTNKELRKRYTVKGMRRHRLLPSGSYFPEVEFTDPITNEVRTLRARLTCDVMNEKDWRK